MRLFRNSNREILLSIERQLENLEGILLDMKNDFAALAAAVALLGTEISTAVSTLKNPAVDNNDQAVIDDLTSKLTAASDALKGALPAAQTDTTVGNSSASGSSDAGASAPSSSDGTNTPPSPDVGPEGTPSPHATAPIPSSGVGSETTGQVDTPVTQ